MSLGKHEMLRWVFVCCRFKGGKDSLELAEGMLKVFVEFEGCIFRCCLENLRENQEEMSQRKASVNPQKKLLDKSL
jgi:hypothetical protein